MRTRLLVLLTALTMAGCSNSISPGSDPYIRGTITSLNSGGFGVRDADGSTRVVSYPRILVEEDPAQSTLEGNTKKSLVSWGANTQFHTRSGRTITAADLKVGDIVSVWIEGVVLDSYPDQVGATHIVVETEIR